MAVEKEDVVVGARGKGVLVAQEIAFAKILAGNNKVLRNRGVKRLARWLKVHSNGRCGMCAKNFLMVGLWDVFPLGFVFRLDLLMVDNCITEFTDDDLMRIWKGLFYCMWMADKPLVQVLVPGEGG
jgi:ribosomal RNA-processing protein 1